MFPWRSINKVSRRPVDILLNIESFHTGTKMRKAIVIILLFLAAPGAFAGKTYTFGIVPQQAASKLARSWIPLLKQVEKESGIKLDFRTDSSISAFEKKLANGEYDFAYMNPYHYVVYHDKAGYQAFGKALDKRIEGIIIVNRRSGIQSLHDLNGEKVAFPSPAAFAASILTRDHFKKQGIHIIPEYVNSHDSVYANVALGRIKAGGGVKRTFKATSPSHRAKLKIIHTTQGYTPHAFANRPDIPGDDVKKIAQALQKLHQSTTGKLLLTPLKLKGIDSAINTDWNDVRKLDIDILK